jgi:hypothetical protein
MCAHDKSIYCLVYFALLHNCRRAYLARISDHNAACTACPLGHDACCDEYMISYALYVVFVNSSSSILNAPK